MGRMISMARKMTLMMKIKWRKVRMIVTMATLLMIRRVSARP